MTKVASHDRKPITLEQLKKEHADLQEKIVERVYKPVDRRDFAVMGRERQNWALQWRKLIIDLMGEEGVQEAACFLDEFRAGYTDYRYTVFEIGNVRVAIEKRKMRHPKRHLLLQGKDQLPRDRFYRKR